MRQRRLIDTVGMVKRPAKRKEITGEVLPALADEGRALVPINTQPAQVIGINLPQPGRVDETADDDTPSSEYERRRVQRAVTWESDVRVPAAQACLTALAFGVMAGLLALAFGWSWRIPAVVLALALAVSWLWRLRLVDGLLWEIETVTGRDLNHDGHKGNPARDYTLANPHDARQQAQRSQRTSKAEQDRAALVQFIHRCYTAGCSEAAHGVKATGPDREQYVKARDVLLSLGVAAWRNPDRPHGGLRMVVVEAEVLALVSQHVL